MLIYTNDYQNLYKYRNSIKKLSYIKIIFFDRISIYLLPLVKKKYICIFFLLHNLLKRN
jgi:hypothetical protein